MKKILIPLLMVIGGIVFGAGGGYAAMLFLKPQSADAKGAAPVATVFVPAGKILAPIVASDGKLSGYANFDVSLGCSFQSRCRQPRCLAICSATTRQASDSLRNVPVSAMTCCTAACRTSGDTRR